MRAAWRPALVFGIVVCLLYALEALLFARGPVRGLILAVNASASAAILTTLGAAAVAEDTSITCGPLAVKIVRGCDALDPIVVFVALVIASPIPLCGKLPGIAIGVMSLIVINLVRIVSLVLIGVHLPRVFEWMHFEVWQAFFIVLAIGLWAVWTQWATRRTTSTATIRT